MIKDRIGERDTIAAISTAPGEGGIAIVRLSGPRAEGILRAAFRPAKPGEVDLGGRRMRYGVVVDENSKILDEVMVVLMHAPHTYTREDMAEIDCHGGSACAQAILRRVLALGARGAEPGEFTRRAYENGRLDLSRAEAVMQLVGAQSESARRASLRQMFGGVSQFILRVKMRLTNLLSRIQVSVDFPEEVDEMALNVETCLELDALAGILEHHADPKRVRMLREGISVVLCGRPNVGKSSLMNALLNTERAIVTDVPGTTRDVLSERFPLGGRTVILSDTAGIRESDDAVERIGIERAENEVEAADIVLLVLDASQPLQEEDRRLLARANDRYILCLNKEDLPQQLDTSELPPVFCSHVSASTGDGVEELMDMLQEFVSGSITDEGCLTVERQMRLAQEGARILRRCLQEIQEGYAPDVVAPDILSVCSLLDDVTGKDASEEVIDAIFANFCVGK